VIIRDANDGDVAEIVEIANALLSATRRRCPENRAGRAGSARGCGVSYPTRFPPCLPEPPDYSVL